jgi:hypothetical protein
MMTTEPTDLQAQRQLQQRLLLARRVEGDRLLLADAVLRAALDGSRALTEAERAALAGSPLTLRRFKTLAQQRQHAAASRAWQASSGMLRAADAGSLTRISTDDGHWTLHFVEHEGAWRVILALDAAAPFAAGLLRERPMLRVQDGAGATILQGSVDSDGECEGPWPFASAPAHHLQQAGAGFAVHAVTN